MVRILICTHYVREVKDSNRAQISVKSKPRIQVVYLCTTVTALERSVGCQFNWQSEMHLARFYKEQNAKYERDNEKRQTFLLS